MASATTAPGQAGQAATAPSAGARPPVRVSPHLVLAVLTVLSLGAVAWSVTAAPPVARTLLRQGAGNTAAASSLQVDESISQVSHGHAALLDAIQLRMERPDRVEQVSQSTQTLVLGRKVYVSPDAGKNWYLDSGAAPVNFALVFGRALQPMRLLQSVPTVHDSRGQTRFTMRVPLAALVNAMHLGLPVSAAAPAVPVTVSVVGEFVTSLTARVTEGAARLIVQVRYSHLDRLPVLVAPLVTGG